MAKYGSATGAGLPQARQAKSGEKPARNHATLVLVL